MTAKKRKPTTIGLAKHREIVANLTSTIGALDTGLVQERRKLDDTVRENTELIKKVAEMEEALEEARRIVASATEELYTAQNIRAELDKLRRKSSKQIRRKDRTIRALAERLYGRKRA